MPDHDVAEQAIRRYLLWLNDPNSIVDVEAIDEAEREAKETVDVIDKLKALSRVEHMRLGDSAAVKRGFLEHAKEWGDRHEISAVSWIRLGVPPDVLREAGITGNRSAAGKSPARSAAQRATPSNRAGRPTGARGANVGIAQVVAHVQTMTGPFVLTDIADQVGGSPMTIRKAVDQMVANGTVERLGADPRHNGRGRAPIRYRTVR
jgi:hypothetical protein